MNGPQLKTVLERGYRNYYYYKYVPGYGGYSYYTTCMLDTNAGNQITYNDTYPKLPDGNNVALADGRRRAGGLQRRHRSTTRSPRSTTWPPGRATSTTTA